MRIFFEKYNERIIFLITGALLGGLFSFLIARTYFNLRKEESKENTDKIVEEIHREQSPEEVILIGSGTVMNYLDSILKENEEGIKIYKKSHMLSGPSATGLDVLMSSSDKNERSLPMIAMSSRKFSFDELKEKRSKINNDATIFYINLLEEDRVRISFYEAEENSQFAQLPFYRKDDMTVDELYGLLTSTLDFDLYLTSNESGTKITFEEAIGSVKQNFKFSQLNLFSQNIYNRKAIKEIRSSNRDAIILHSGEYSFNENLSYKYLWNDKHYVCKSLGFYLIGDNVKIDNGKLKFNNDKRGEFLNSLFSFILKKKDLNSKVIVDSLKSQNYIEFLFE